MQNLVLEVPTKTDGHNPSADGAQVVRILKPKVLKKPQGTLPECKFWPLFCDVLFLRCYILTLHHPVVWGQSCQLRQIWLLATCRVCEAWIPVLVNPAMEATGPTLRGSRMSWAVNVLLGADATKSPFLRILTWTLWLWYCVSKMTLKKTHTMSCVKQSFRCWKAVAFKTLMEMCRLFWALSKPAQDSLLWAMQCGGSLLGEDSDSSASASDAESSSEEPRYVKWYLAGQQVCRRAFLRMLGIGAARVIRTRKRFQGKDERTLKGQGGRTRPANATASVDAFLQKMYYSISESMPTGFLCWFLCLDLPAGWKAVDCLQQAGGPDMYILYITGLKGKVS